MIKKLIATAIATAFVGAVSAQTVPVAPTQASAPAITTQLTNSFSSGVAAALGNSTTNIIYLQQTGNHPTVSINQDGNGNRAGSDSAGTINSVILDGATQVVTIDQTGNNNIINTLKLLGDGATVYLQQLGNSNTVNASCGLTTRCESTQSVIGNANLDWRLDSTGKNTGNTLNYTGNGPNLTSAIYVTGGGNTINSLQTSTVGQQQLINLTGSDNNTVNVTQTSASLSSLVLTQTGTGGTAFTVSQTGTFSNVANISAVAAGGSFNIIQRSR